MASENVPQTPPEEERRLLELMMRELRSRSQELVMKIEALTQSLGRSEAADADQSDGGDAHNASN